MTSARIMRLLLIGLAVCAGVTSCKPSESQAIAGRDGPPSGKAVLPTQEMLTIASAAGVRYEWDPDWWRPILVDAKYRGWRSIPLQTFFPPTYDQGQPVWPEVTDAELQKAIVAGWPVLKGHDYQVIKYIRNPDAPGAFGIVDGEGYILIDRNTGEVLLVLSWNGRVLTPESVGGVLPKRKFIDIAATAGPRYGFDPEKWKAIIGSVAAERRNVEWNAFLPYVVPRLDENGDVLEDRVWSRLVGARWPMLKDRDYQALYYMPADEKPDPFSGYNFFSRAGGWILIDRHTGEIILVVDRQGQVVIPVAT